MKYVLLIAILYLLAGCTAPAIVHEQLNYNAHEMLNSDHKLTPFCTEIVTVTKTPSSWWSVVAPVREVRTTLACTR